MAFGPFLLLATLEGLLQAAVLTLTALGLSLVFGVMRVVNVAHGEFYMLGAVVAWWVTSTIGLPPAIAFFVALIISPMVVGAVALTGERLILKRLNYNPESTIVATIGMLYIIQQTVLLTYGPDARPVTAPFYYRIQLPWFGYSGYNLFVIAAAGVLLLLVWFVLSRTRLGLVMRATQFDSETAQAFGIPIERVYAFVFAAGAMLAAVAAVLIVPIRQAHYLMGLDPLLLSFIVVIIGGLGSLRGTVVAALLIGLSDGIISVFFSPTLAKMISTLLVALVLVFKPEGLFGAKAR
ncbi:MULTISPECIES: branched-chain amino acid ABC transporter permease [Alphaproteobacteria]|uniref:Branched-chain amino acid ABC transporter permease n=2 Tax=Alphaproteobacteria TaxID=28211 RepID=A0A512HMG2_9HYPH|nr:MULTISPECIES: branched-chain amino acid ABC transporter permease [Alphaproteobacteria]GEO86641.1 branched-chain amino acid ABC transporter permease [Ciceribacter naphthalenivorans]GLR23629.1 branched-chain amino acid ABC transporter permease [Ciceribacter naphthalenivorans]GLT06485.1 branched-chain amino acid ABC transporter permease [Sphingomonas psychrolutea]